MKHLLSTTVIGVFFTLILFSSCYFPGSDQAKIKSATTCYVKTQLGEGEKYQWGYLERKNGKQVNGKDCKYAEVHYDIINKEGETEHKMLFLLMSEHCDSVYDITGKRDKEWVSKEGPSSEEIKALIKNALNR